MRNTNRQAKAEIKQLPYMLVKLLGGCVTVGGFTAAVVVITRKPVASLSDAIPALLLGIAGVVIFLLATWQMPNLSLRTGEAAFMATGGISTSVLSWILLLFFGGIFLSCTYFLTK